MKLRWDLVGLAYLASGLLGAGLSMWLNGPHPLLHPRPQLVLDTWQRHALSLGLGVAAGMLVVASSRLALARTRWARRLHAELRPVAAGMSGKAVLWVAVTSSLGEELLFRSLLAPLVGIWLQGLFFGVLHQTRGPSRWIWVAWATAIGLGFGWLYAVTGSLAGPLAAHALVNGVNLLYLRDHDPGPVS